MAFTILLPMIEKGSLVPAFSFSSSPLSFERKSLIIYSQRFLSGSFKVSLLSFIRLELEISLGLIYSGGIGRFLEDLADGTGSLLF